MTEQVFSFQDHYPSLDPNMQTGFNNNNSSPLINLQQQQQQFYSSSYLASFHEELQRSSHNMFMKNRINESFENTVEN